MSDRSKKPAGAAVSRLIAEAELGETKAKILDAAFRRLIEEGYAALSVREIAKDAGVNHALINYHFRTKDQLVIAVLEAANRRLLDRQQRMYRGDASFAEKWAQARSFYDDDLASGFVRLQAELFAASFSNPGLREKFVPQVMGWKKLVVEGVRDALSAFKSAGGQLPSPFTADVIGCWIAEFWLGMEFVNLIEGSPKDAEHTAALDAVQQLLEQLDTRVRKERRSRPSTKAKRSKHS